MEQTMNFLQMGETWVDMDKVYTVSHENWRDYLETEPRLVYVLQLTNAPGVVIPEADAAPLLAWLDAHKRETKLHIMSFTEDEAKEAGDNIVGLLIGEGKPTEKLFKAAAYLDLFRKQHKVQRQPGVVINGDEAERVIEEIQHFMEQDWSAEHRLAKIIWVVLDFTQSSELPKK